MITLMNKIAMAALFFAATAALIACDDGEEEASSPQETDNRKSTDEDGDTGTEAPDVIVASIVVPQDFNGAPVLLGISFFASDPPQGMPVAFGDRYENPEIVAGSTLPISTTQAGLQGDYYMTVILYCEGGGNGQAPVAGVDWVGKVNAALTLGPGTGTVDAGQINIVLAQ